MTVYVTVQTGATDTVLVPFTTSGNAALAQDVMDQLNQLVVTPPFEFLKYYFPPEAGGLIAPPDVPFFGGIVDTIPAAVQTNVLDHRYTMVVNAGSGVLAGIGGINTSVVSGQNATTLFINQSSFGQAFLGGGNNVFSNANTISRLELWADDAPAGLGSSTLILDDSAGGGMTLHGGNGLLVQLIGGGADSIVAQPGTLAVLGAPAGTGATGVATIGAAGPEATVWVGAQGGSLFITPGAGNAFIFQGEPGAEHAVTLFGGTAPWNTGITAPAYTGRTTVLGMNGWLESGAAGGSIMQSGTTAGAATLVAGGAGDLLLLRAPGDLAVAGSAAGVFIDASNGIAAGTQGADFEMGTGSGTVFGAAIGHNTFRFTGAGNYTVAGFHDQNLQGSTYIQAAGSGSAGTITILDFVPQQVVQVGEFTVGGAIFDQFVIGNRQVASLAATDLGGGYFDNRLVLTDGTTVNFLHTFGAVHQGATAIV